MKMRLQYRVFFYQALMLAVFIVLQLLLFAAVEYHGWRQHPTEPLAEELMEVVYALAFNVVLLPFMLALAWWFSRRMLAPVHRIADTAMRIGNGRFDERIDTPSMPDDDMRHLAESLNAAFTHYASAVHRLRRFSGDASHQIRTPIAAMRATGEVAISRPRAADAYRSAIQDMLSELERLSFMIEQLLQLSRLEAGALRERFQEIRSDIVVQQCVQFFAPLCEEADVTLECSVEPGIRVLGIDALIVELLHNLLDNAIRHTPRGGAIRIGVRRADGNALFYVHDSGSGIPAEFTDRIFERFAQIPGSRQGSAGLGLALASDIAVVHGGKLVLANPGQPGARFEWSLPILVD